MGVVEGDWKMRAIAARDNVVLQTSNSFEVLEEAESLLFSMGDSPLYGWISGV